MANVTSERKRVTGWLATGRLVGNESGEGHRRKLHLLASHFAELGDHHLDGVRNLVEIGIVSPLVPIEKGRVVDEILDQEIAGIKEEFRRFRDLVKRSNRRSEDVKHRESEVAAFRHVDETDIA